MKDLKLFTLDKVRKEDSQISNPENFFALF